MTLDLARLDLVVLARAATALRPSIADISKATQRYAPAGTSPAAWRATVEKSLDRLTRKGPIDRKRLDDRLGSRDAGWRTMTTHALPALALGIPSGRALKKVDWAAAIVARADGIWTTGAPPHVSALCNRLVWRALSLPGAAKPCPPEIQLHFLRQLLGAEASTRERAMRELAAKHLDVPRFDLARDALVRNWLEVRALGATTQQPPTSITPPPPRPTTTVPFASAVQHAARGLRHGLLGEHKVFISAAWDAMRGQPSWASLDLPTFKSRLVAAHRAGELKLSRADFVTTMDPALVAASETRADGATFHFIVREGA